MSPHGRHAQAPSVMTSDLDIYRTANMLVKHYGEDAVLEAAQRADAMLEKGSLDVSGCGGGCCPRWRRFSGKSGARARR